MKRVIFLTVAILFASCAGDVQHPDFEKNVELSKKFFQLHGEENYTEMKDMMHDDVKWTSPKYGEGIVDKATQLGYVKMYQDLYEDIKFTANYWLPGVDTLTLKNDGSVRVYGSWTGKHSETGNEFDLGSYHTFAWDKDDKLVGGGDWFDLTGFVMESTKAESTEE
tara:strand:+ start:3811 stop:4308 length:498 start_codon:yes stop_codon:yes gene_type:complete